MVGSGWCNKMVWVFFVNLKKEFGDIWRSLGGHCRCHNPFEQAFESLQGVFHKIFRKKMGF